MSEQEQQIAIAEACGWHVSNLSVDGRPEVVWVLYDPTGKEIAFGQDVRPKDLPTYAAVFSTDSLPDYYHDLNAMHEAIKTLDRRQRIIFCNNLTNICGGTEEAIDASAAKRAKAFLLTVNKWKE